MAAQTLLRGAAPAASHTPVHLDSNLLVANVAGDYGDRLRYVTIKVNLTINAHDQDLAEGRATMDAWRSYLGTQMASMPPALQSVMISTPETLSWTWMDVQKVCNALLPAFSISFTRFIVLLISQELFTNLIRGLLLGLMFLWLGILLSTGNYILATIAVFTCAWVIIIIFGITAFSNWSLGVPESLLFTMIVPLSTIPITLLALPFRHAPGDSRRARMRMALGEAGPPVLFCT